MTASFNNIAGQDCRAFIAERLSDNALLGREGFLMRQSTYILPYPPEQEHFAKDLINALINTELPNKSVKAVNINLYDIALEYLDKQDLWNPLCETEGEASRNELIMMLQDTINVSEVLKPRIEQQIKDSDCELAFITGVGETYPYIRTHSLLSQIDTAIPIVLVFPGKYRQSPDGSSSLDILNVPSESNGGYYRATNIFIL